MDATEKNFLTNEVSMQCKAIKKIKKWASAATLVSTIGVVVTYTAFAGEIHYIFPGILGIAAIILGAAGSLVLNLGIKNGKRNVKK